MDLNRRRLKQRNGAPEVGHAHMHTHTQLVGFGGKADEPADGAVSMKTAFHSLTLAPLRGPAFNTHT